MSTTTKRTPGRPKKFPESQAAQPAVESVPFSTPTPKEPAQAVKYREPQQKSLGAVFQAVKGGITYMLPQAGITIFDEETNRVREIRYCENMPSIYVDEQGDHARRGSIVFRDGSLFVPPNKPQLIDYMRAHPGNMENGGSKFFEHKPSEKKEKSLDNEFQVVDAVAAVRDKSISELLPVAMMYGISTDQKPSDIRYDLLAHAKKNPSQFMASFDNPMVKARAIIKQATDFQILRSKPEGYYWFDTNGLIVACPVGQDPLDVMTRFCLTERGAPVLMEVEDRLAKLD